MIASNELESLLTEFDMGASTAENDPLLETAKIETQEFHDLYYHDRIDIIKGIKGSGKTALYRLFNLLRAFLIRESKLYCVFGVEPSGDPIFRLYQNDFSDFTETEFENFWNIYFIALAYNLVHTDEQLKGILSKDLAKIDEIIDSVGLKFTKKGFTLKESIGAIQKLFRRKVKIGVKAGIDPNTGMMDSVSPVVEFSPPEEKDISVRPLYVSKFRDELTRIFQNHGLKLWLMIDRLDEVFLHRSEVERRGLKGLLKASYNISHPNLRIKIFLRDDIIGYLASEGFTALTHVTDRCSSTMSWSKDGLIHLITKRIAALAHFARYFSINSDKIEKDKSYRENLFYQIFPEKIGQTATMDWIYIKCADSNGIVTPRDIIDFFKFAKAEQIKQFRLNPKGQEKLISPETFQIALNELSKHKKETFLYAEFPHLKNFFLKFEGKFSEYDEPAIAEILGENYLKTLDDLKSIGFIKYVPKSATYKIPVIWRKGFNMRRKTREAREKQVRRGA